MTTGAIERPHFTRCGIPRKQLSTVNLRRWVTIVLVVTWVLAAFTYPHARTLGWFFALTGWVALFGLVGLFVRFVLRGLTSAAYSRV